MTRKVKIISEVREYDDFFKVDRAILQYEKVDGEMSPTIERLNFNRGDAVAVLLYDRKKDSVLLVNQFRYPAYVNDGPGWLLEIAAGMIDEGRDAISVAKAELHEEMGYEVDDLKFICRFYLSPGGSSEKIWLYFADCHRKVSSGGGKDSENEDIEVIEVPFMQALEMIRAEEICDAKTIVALQWLHIERLSKTVDNLQF